MLKGSLVALITPMDVKGDVDYNSLSRLIDFHIKEGTDALVVLGTTGESATFSQQEHVDVARFVVEKAAKRIPIIAGNGANCTRKAVALTQALSELDLAAMLSVTPYYNKPSPKGLIAHHRAVSQSTTIPQILYNVPSRTGVDMRPETVAELAQIPQIIGCKEATGDILRVKTLRQLCGDDFLLFSGDDETAKDFMLLGGDGVISVVNNVVPRLFKEMCNAALRQDKNMAEELNQMLKPLAQDLFIEANPIPVKWAAHTMGLIENGTLRLPLTQLSEVYRDRVTQALKHAKTKAVV
tara:strand:+ start:1791 stop:2678 length:888 start_codon:yes stop_codon:yes gene_type:complete